MQENQQNQQQSQQPNQQPSQQNSQPKEAEAGQGKFPLSDVIFFASMIGIIAILAWQGPQMREQADRNQMGVQLLADTLRTFCTQPKSLDEFTMCERLAADAESKGFVLGRNITKNVTTGVGEWDYSKI